MTALSVPGTAPVPADHAGLAAAGRGAIAVAPLLVAFIPFALVVGSAATVHGGPLAAWAGSWLIFGGSAHLATVRTLDAGPVAAILTGLLVNARLLVYSTSLGHHWADQPRWFRFAAAGMIIDPTWAIGDRHAATGPDPREQRGYFLGAGLTLGAGWTSAIAVGALIGARLDAVDLSIVVPLCLLALIGAGIRERGARSVIVGSAAVALLTVGWPSGTGLLAAVLTGCAIGVVNERRRGS
jgi:predicted branched-subunit amino acid permease